jgi:hypothetical protein
MSSFYTQALQPNNARKPGSACRRVVAPRSLFAHNRDGNTRGGLIAMVTFLGLTGKDLVATDSEVLTIILQIAASRVTEADVADWVRHHIVATT